MCTLSVVHSRGLDAEPASVGGITGPVRYVMLPRVRLVVGLRRSAGVEFLDVKSLADPAQNLLLPVAHRPVVAGLSCFTAVGRFHAVYWALAYGLGEPPDGVRFESGTLRYRREVDVAPNPVADGCWVAAAEGVFTTATVLVGNHATHRVRLADRW